MASFFHINLLLLLVATPTNHLCVYLMRTHGLYLLEGLAIPTLCYRWHNWKYTMANNTSCGFQLSSVLMNNCACICRAFSGEMCV